MLGLMDDEGAALNRTRVRTERVLERVRFFAFACGCFTFAASYGQWRQRESAQE